MLIRSLSATSLQDFLDCRRRFQLKYIDQISWPQPLNTVNIKQMESMTRGREFHQLMQQHFLGIPDEKLLKSIDDNTLKTWFINTIESEICKIDQAEKLTEYRLSTYISDTLVTGVIDLLISQPDSSLKIIDWKTGLTKPKPQFYVSRIQTRLYPLLLAQSPLFHARITNKQCLDKIEFIYWFTHFPQLPIINQYSPEKFDLDKVYLAELINTIQNTQVNEMKMTANFYTCRTCQFQVYCGRISSESAQDVFDMDEIDYELPQFNEPFTTGESY